MKFPCISPFPCQGCCCCHSVVSDSATSWTAAQQASLSFTISQSLLRLMSIELVMPFNHLILCCSLHLPVEVTIGIYSSSFFLCKILISLPTPVMYTHRHTYVLLHKMRVYWVYCETTCWFFLLKNIYLTSFYGIR